MMPMFFLYSQDLQSVLNFVYSPIENGSEEETELNENEKTFPAKKISLRQTMILSATLTVANQHLTEKAVESKTSQEIQTGAIAPILKKVIVSFRCFQLWFHDKSGLTFVCTLRDKQLGNVTRTALLYSGIRIHFFFEN